MSKSDPVARKGRQAALVIAGTGVAWVLFGLIADKEGFSVTTRIVGDLVALGGFGFAFFLIYQMWRSRQDEKR
ncbi:MAG: DUF5337 domain-containing protein [Pseudomonadota bacterium]